MQTTRNVSFLHKLFPVPRFLTLDPVGVDVSPSAICAMKLKHGAGGLVPDVFHEEILSEECPLLESHEDMKKCAPLREALQKTKEKLDIEFVSVSLPEQKTYIFKTTLPVEAIKTIEDALMVKIQENIPLTPDEILYDFAILPTQANQKVVDVVVTAFPKSVIDAYTTLFAEMGMTAISFESESQANARAVVRHHDDTPYLMIDMGHTKINLAIIERGVVHYTSSIPYASEEIVADFTSTSAQALKTKINKLLVYWFTNKHDPETNEKITNVILTGPFANAPNLVDFFERHLRINVDVANVWQNCFDLNQHIPEMPHADSTKYGTAIGLALMHH